MKTGLVLEGGGLRGVFTAGVLDVLMENGIEFDGGIGVSAGAAFGCNYKSKQPRRAIRYNLRFAKDPRYSSLRSLLSTGDLFNAQFCYHEIPEKLDPFDWAAFRENPMEFYLVCTDVETGKPVYHLCDHDESWEMLEWFRASGSMPMVSRVVEVGGYRLLDGGISDSIPLKFMEEQGYGRNVVVLTRPADYVKHSSPVMRVMSRALHQYPATVEALANRHKVYNETVAYIRKREAGGYAFVIRPEEDLDIGRVEHDRYKIRETYKAGRKAARRQLDAIRRFLENAKKDMPDLNASMIESPEEKKQKKSSVVSPSLVEGFPQKEEESPALKAPAGENVPEKEESPALNAPAGENVPEKEEITGPDAPAAETSAQSVERNLSADGLAEEAAFPQDQKQAEPVIDASLVEAVPESEEKAEPVIDASLVEAAPESEEQAEPVIDASLVEAAPESREQAEAIIEAVPAEAGAESEEKTEPVADVSLVEAAPAETDTQPGGPHIPVHGRRRRRGWKPGNMTALKQRSRGEQEE